MTNISGYTYAIDNFLKFPFKMGHWYLKELSTMDTKKAYKNNERNLLVDAGLNMIGKKIKGKIGPGITLTNNEIKDIMEVINSLENWGISLKEMLQKILVKKKDLSIFLSINYNWFNIHDHVSITTINMNFSCRCSYSK